MRVCKLYCAKCPVVIGEALLLCTDLMTRVCSVDNFIGQDKVNKYLCISPDILCKNLKVSAGSGCFWEPHKNFWLVSQHSLSKAYFKI